VSLRYFIFAIKIRNYLNYKNYLLQYGGANIQLLDLPGIIEGASQGKGNQTKSIPLLINDNSQAEGGR